MPGTCIGLVPPHPGHWVFLSPLLRGHPTSMARYPGWRPLLFGSGFCQSWPIHKLFHGTPDQPSRFLFNPPPHPQWFRLSPWTLEPPTQSPKASNDLHMGPTGLLPSVPKWPPPPPLLRLPDMFDHRVHSGCFRGSGKGWEGAGERAVVGASPSLVCMQLRVINSPT